MTSKTKGLDRYEGHDYYLMDELLSEEHLLARQAVRDWVKQEVSQLLKITATKLLVLSIYLRDWLKSELLVPASPGNTEVEVWMKLPMG